MRLFVAVRPPVAVVDGLAALSRPAQPGVRWTTSEQWHVTLRFFGDVDDPTPITDALTNALDGTGPITATIGPHAAVLDKRVIYLPVTGLEGVATTIGAATAAFGDPPRRGRFKGHLTLARTKGARVDLSALDLEHTWEVDEVDVLRSHLGSEGARYETLERFALSS
jgi:2'-5' RNA ligase